MPSSRARARNKVSSRILKACHKIRDAIRSPLDKKRNTSSSPSRTRFAKMANFTAGAAAAAVPSSSKLQGFPLLANLPMELQCHVLSCLSIRALSKGLARTNRYWHALIDAHIRRELLALVAGTSGVEDREPRTQLIFEAQRPIDTVVSKHSLFFSHFGVTNSMPGGVFSTIANFVFVPPAVQSGEDEKQQGSQPVSRASSRGPPAPPKSVEEVAMQRGVHPSLLGRLREEHHSSSVVARSRSASRSEGFTFVAAPLDHRDAQPVAGASSSPNSTLEPQANRGNFSSDASIPEAGIDDLFPVASAYDWGAPVSSQVGGGMSPSSMRSRSRARGSGTALPKASRGKGPYQQPTYKMQLDPLDSFETWILSLTIRSKKQIGSTTRSRAGYPSSTPGSAPASYDSGYSQTLRFQKRVAEGLDRVYRDWFYAPSTAATEASSSTNPPGSSYQAALWQASVTPEVLSTFGAINLAGPSRHPEQGIEQASQWPSLRKLEVDNASCQAVIQPHPGPTSPESSSSSGSAHPALLSSYSHAYLGSSTAYSHLNSTHRMEMKFHVQSLEVHAGRLLSALLDLEGEVSEAVADARGRAAGVGGNRYGLARAGEAIVASVSGGSSATSAGASGAADAAAAAQFMGLTDGAWAGRGALPYGRQQMARRTEYLIEDAEMQM